MRKHSSRFIVLGLLHLLVFSMSMLTASAYSNSGSKWAGTSVSYYINSSFTSSTRSAMQAADASWDGGGSVFRLKYAGTTARNPNVWSGYALDTYSDIGYYNNGATLVVATTTGGISGTTLTERDTTLNTYYGFTTTGTAGSYDVQNILAHEFGHWLKLSDLSSGGYPSFCGIAVESTMCGSVYTSETRKRSLSSDDKAGIVAIYGT